MRRAVRAAAAALAALGCAVQEPAPPSAGVRPLGEVRVGEAALDPRAFVARAALIYPEESREVARSLLRAELAAREAERLGLSPDAERAEAELAAFEAELAAGLGAGETLESWSRARYGRPWTEARRALSEQLLANQLYQLAVRAQAHAAGRVRVHWLVTGDEGVAAEWARRLRSGADPRVIGAESPLRGSEPDGSFAAASARLPAPHAAALEGARAGAVVGPLRFDGDRSWWVGRVAEALPPGPVPPRDALLAELDRAPLSPLEGRAWFEAMLSRYTAAEGAPPLTAPVPSFVPSR